MAAAEIGVGVAEAVGELILDEGDALAEPELDDEDEARGTSKGSSSPIVFPSSPTI